METDVKGPTRAVDRVIDRFGGLARFAKALGHTHCTTVQGWKDRGAIPLKQHVHVLEAAQRLEIPLTRDDLLDEVAPRPPEEMWRAQCYMLLARLLATPPDDELLGMVRELGGDDTEFGQALRELAAVTRQTSSRTVRDEYHDLFIGVGRGELLPYASYYLTGFLHEKPLAVLRGDMQKLGIAAKEGVAEPEDHIAALCEMIAGLITGAFGAPASLDVQRSFFETHIGSWAPRFFQDLEAAQRATFYKPVGRLGRIFMSIEMEAFALAE